MHFNRNLKQKLRKMGDRTMSVGEGSLKKMIPFFVEKDDPLYQPDKPQSPAGWPGTLKNSIIRSYKIFYIPLGCDPSLFADPLGTHCTHTATHDDSLTLARTKMGLTETPWDLGPTGHSLRLRLDQLSTIETLWDQLGGHKACYDPLGTRWCSLWPIGLSPRLVETNCAN